MARERSTTDWWGGSLSQFTLRIFVALLLGVLLLAMWTLREALLLAFLAVLLAIAFQGPVRRLERWGLHRSLSILVTLAGLVLLLVVVGNMIVTVFVEQSRELIDQLPDAAEQARLEYEDLTAQYTWLPNVDWDQLTSEDASDFVTEQAGNLSRNIFPFLSGVGGVVANVVFVLFIALFFVGDPTDYVEGALSLVPRSYRPRALEILTRLENTLRAWFIGQMISMTMLGTMIFLLDAVILDLPSPLALGVIAGVMEFVPNFGSILSVVPAVLVALAKDPGLVPWVIVAYIGTQQVQSNLIMPRIMARQIELPAATVLMAQLIAAALFGFLGLLLAVPLTVVVMVLTREIYVRDALNSGRVRVETHYARDGSKHPVVISEAFRPDQLSPGEAAQLQAQGMDPFEYREGQVVEIVTPASPALEQTARNQQAVWLALLVLIAAQALALVRGLLAGGKQS